MYVSPVISEESRTGRAIVELDNTQGTWHPGDFVSAPRDRGRYQQARLMFNSLSGLNLF